MQSDPANAEETVKVLEANDGLRRVRIVRRSDAVYSFDPKRGIKTFSREKSSQRDGSR